MRVHDAVTAFEKALVELGRCNQEAELYGSFDQGDYTDPGFPVSHFSFKVKADLHYPIVEVTAHFEPR